MAKVLQMNYITYMQGLARKLAKSSKYQTIYSQYKELGTKIFANDYDYTAYQVNFIHYLSFYASLMLDIYMGEVSDIVLKDELYEDAYMEYKSKERQKKKKSNTEQNNRPQNKPIKNKIDTKTPIKSTEIVFRKKNKRN